MSNGLGKIKSVAVSSGWSHGYVGIIRDILYNTLKGAESDIKTTAFALGRNNNEVNGFLKMPKDLLRDQREIRIVVNDDGRKNGTCSDHVKKKIFRLAKNFSEKFSYQYFSYTKSKILHANLTIPSDKITPVGSANISKNSLVSNYEIALKIGSPATATSLMFDKFSKNLEDQE